jgi:hypothetical protein
VAGRAAGLGDDADDLEAFEHHGLRRPNLGRRKDDRLVAAKALRALLQSQLRGDAVGDVADVGQAFADVLVGDLVEQAGVIVNDGVNSGRGVEPFLSDRVGDFADDRGVAQQRAMGAKDGGLVLADVAGDPLDDGPEFGGDGGDGVFEAADFRRQRRRIEHSRILLGHRLIEAIDSGERDARRDGNAFDHGVMLEKL